MARAFCKEIVKKNNGKNTQSNNSARESHFFGITLFCCSRHTARNFVVGIFIGDVNTLWYIFFINLDAVSKNSFFGKFAYVEQVENWNDQDRLLGCLSYNPCTLYTQPLLVMKAIKMDLWAQKLLLWRKSKSHACTVNLFWSSWGFFLSHDIYPPFLLSFFLYWIFYLENKVFLITVYCVLINNRLIRVTR